MAKRGCLRSKDGSTFLLAPKVTTVGREGCDLVAPVVGVDYQHAVIEYSDQEDCFVLQDLNTQQGTFVNDCRIQNAAVRLAPGDDIRFGNNNSTFRFELDTQVQKVSNSNVQSYIQGPSANQQPTYPTVQQRGAWTQPLSVLNGTPSPPQFLNTETLPQLQSVTKATTTTWGHQLGGVGGIPGYQPNVAPRPPVSMRGRPVSAGGNIPQTYVGRRTDKTQNSVQAFTPIPQGNVTHRAVQGGGWVSMGPLSARNSNQSSPALISLDTSGLQDKDKQLTRLMEEVKRLGMYESECIQKDEHVLVLREEIAELQKHLRQLEVKKSSQDDADITQKLLTLENEVSMKKSEILTLKDQIQQLKTTESRENSPGLSRQELNNRISEVNSLRQELERVKKDKNIMSGLVTSMQRDMANKDTTVTRMTQELESLKSENTDKNVQLVSMQSKFKKADENRKFDEELENKEKELTMMRLKLKSSETKIEEHNSFINELKEELNKKQQSAKDDQEAQKSVEFELESTKAKYLDMERTERLVRVDLEQAAKRFERLKNRVVQVTFSTPGIKAPSGELADDTLFDTLKKIVDERTELKRKITDINENMASVASHKKDSNEQVKKLRGQLSEAVANLRGKGLTCSHLRNETDKLRCMNLEEDLVWVRDGMVSILNMNYEWEQQIETSLEECGINMKISERSPSAHILDLKAKGNELKSEKVQLNTTLSNMSEKYRTDLEAALKQQREELQNTVSDEVARVKSQQEEVLKQRISEIHLTADEKLEAGIEAEKVKFTELSTQLADLKASMQEREQSESSNKEATRIAIEQLENYKTVEIDLRQTIANLEGEKAELNTKLSDTETRWGEKTSKEVEAYKEEIKQHSVTICAMTERVNKLVTRNKSYQAENNGLKQSMNELRSKPRPAPKPQVIIQKPVQDVVAMEQLIVQLRREIVDHKKQQQDHQNTIIALRKDIAGAAARLSDMTGELSEEQKQQMEKNRAMVLQKDQELVESRQQLAKLSQIIDQQGAEIKSQSTEISKHLSQLTKFKNTSNEKESSLKELQSKLDMEITEKKKQREEIEDEGRITSEMTALGAQCRGERHEQIITRQREALMELRTRVKSLEQVRPPIPSHDQALQQVILLKKELAEMRANNAMTDVNTKALTSTLEHHVNKSRGLEMSTDASVERSAHRETLDSLETSENTFLIMLRGVASALEMDDIGGLRSMAHIPRDERRHLATQREHSCEVITSKIRALRERVARKDELLQGYERDLAKLRQAEKLAEHKHAQVESLSADVRTRVEESQYLRESLSKTRDKLDQEKRLNSSIKQKKTFHLENETKHCGPFPTTRHTSCHDDIFGKQAAKKKAQNESMKRKNYEIRVLKGELSQRDQDLVNAKTRLTTLESSGYGIDEPAVDDLQ